MAAHRQYQRAGALRQSLRPLQKLGVIAFKQGVVHGRVFGDIGQWQVCGQQFDMVPERSRQAGKQIGADGGIDPDGFGAAGQGCRQLLLQHGLALRQA